MYAFQSFLVCLLNFDPGKFVTKSYFTLLSKTDMNSNRNSKPIIFKEEVAEIIVYKWMDGLCEEAIQKKIDPKIETFVANV
jgi:hypothetical protein